MSTVFFDLDGTLTNPFVGITTCIQHALRELGQPPPRAEALARFIGPPLRATFVELVGEAQADAAVALYRDRFSTVGLFENEVYDGVEAALDALLAAGITCHVASSKPHVFVEKILAHFNLRRFFTQVFGSELDGTRADKAQLLAYALQQTGTVGGLMIGDRRHDVVGALANDLTPVGVLYGFGDARELIEAGAEHLVAQPAELPALIEGLVSPQAGR